MNYNNDYFRRLIRLTDPLPPPEQASTPVWDQLDRESAEGDLLSPDSALYSRVSDLESSASSSGTASHRSSYTYPSSSSTSSSGSSPNNTYQTTTRNVLQTRNDDDDEDDDDETNYRYHRHHHRNVDSYDSDEQFNNRNNNNRTAISNGNNIDDSEDFEGTLTFTNRSRSGSLDNDLNNESEHDRLNGVTHKRWRNAPEEDDSTNIPIVYSRLNEDVNDEEDTADRRKEEEQQEEEDYIPVYSAERLRELTGEDNFQFSSGSHRRRRRRNRGYTSDNTEYVGPRDRFM